MTRIGSRITGMRQRPQALLASKTDRFVHLAPSDQWNGLAGSGFASVPADPARLTAKPALRLIVPPNQHFTRQLLVGVIGFANANGTLIGGLDRVRFTFEGTSRDVIEPSFQTFTRADGSRYKCLGYWALLEKPADMVGEGHFYAEAIPADATMQSRIIGPYSFSMVDDLHDFVLTVAPSQEPIAGQRFQTLGAALDYLCDQNAQNPHVTITEAMTEDLSETVSTTSAYVGSGYCTITASAPVTFARPAYTGDASSLFRPRYNRLHFKGSNITFDMRYVRELWSETNVEGEHWLDGCRFTNSAGRGDYWRLGSRPIAHLVRGKPWFTECRFDEVSDPTTRGNLVRGCLGQNIYRDFTGDPGAVLYNQITSLDATIEWLKDVPAMTVTYLGSEASATLKLAGANDSNTRTFTATWGSQTATFVIGASEARYLLSSDAGYDATTAGQGYSVDDVATWLNSLPGWSANVLDNTRRASALSIAGVKGRGFNPISVKDTALELVTCFDLHGDFFQHFSLQENCVVAFNTGVEMRGQNIFVGSNTVSPKDFVFIGNAFANVLSIDGYARVDQVSSQFMRQPFSHLVYCHNTMPVQRLLLRTAQGFIPDQYSIVGNNYHLGLSWNGSANSDLSLINNSVDEFQVLPEGSIGGFAAGNGFTKLKSAYPVDFSPAGELLTMPAAPVLRYDVDGRERQNPDAIGALAIN